MKWLRLVGTCVCGGGNGHFRLRWWKWSKVIKVAIVITGEFGGGKGRRYLGRGVWSQVELVEVVEVIAGDGEIDHDG